MQRVRLSDLAFIAERIRNGYINQHLGLTPAARLQALAETQKWEALYHKTIEEAKQQLASKKPANDFWN